ncbi:MAG TPA: carboxypeptidase regulatory-like domain-containing protein [Vicinamibacterales bacterium]|nr:carboxypeptidase regulatory-like domain-containing protein [Vicinamibacterales bacterium]
MKSSIKAFGSLTGFLCLLLLGGASLSAQTATTGSLLGVVTDAQGGVLPGATISAVHTPTNTTYEAVTGGDGRYNILNLRVGPYTVSATMSGFRKEERLNVPVTLGEQRTVDFRMSLETIAETVDVMAAVSIIDSSRAGTADNVSQAAVENLPTISRNLLDIARTSPYFNPTGLNDEPLAVSVAGRNNRYNNVQIDGAVYNDVFGLAASGTPGGQTETQPISLDAIQELQLLVSPYDVRQGGFSGGGINAITKSGTNDLHGTGYFFGRNQDWVGESPTGTKVGQFKDQQFGASLGGRVVRDRAFFFGNVDWSRRDNPSGVSVSGSGQQFGRTDEIDRFLNILRTQYGYDPGGTEEFIRTVDSDKIFVRGDVNLTVQHRLTARHNYLDALNDIGRPDLQTYFMPDNFYRIANKTNSFVTQLNSTFGTAVNEFRFTYTRVRDRRGAQPFEERPFPFVRVNLSSGSVRAGRENFSTANELDQDVVEINNDLTWLRGNHTLTIGTHNEFFDFRNLFIRDNFGNYTFNSLDLFEQGLAQSFDYSFSLTGNPKQPAEFRVRQYGFYAGDQWRPVSALTLTFGVRADIPTFPDKPTANPASEAAFGYRTDEVPSGVLWSPRIGFNYAIGSGNDEQIRGGFGLFSGRTPYVWLSNQFGNTGIEFRRISLGFNANNRILFSPDPDAQPTNIGNAATNEIDLIDPDYKYPSLIRTNLGYDRNLGMAGLTGTVEFLYSHNVNDIKYQNLNLRQTGTRPDGRPIFQRNLVPTLSDVIFLTNTDEGDSWSIVFKVDRPLRDRFFANASYLYGRSNSIMDGTSSQAASNWGNVYVPGDPNNPPLSRSNFDPGHRITLSGGYEIPLGGNFSATASAFYSGQSGRPYSLSYNLDYNGDLRGFNDLVYIPAGADEVQFTNGTFADFQQFIASEDCLSEFTGRIHERNACRSPWMNTFDFRVNVGLPFNRVKAEITWDVLNVINLFGSGNGLVEWANFNQLTVIRPTFAANGQPIYNLSGLFRNGQLQTAEELMLRDDLRSRWQMQLGGRIRF